MQKQILRTLFFKRKVDETKWFLLEYNIDIDIEIFLKQFFTEVVLQNLGIFLRFLLDFDFIEMRQGTRSKVKTYESASSMHWNLKRDFTYFTHDSAQFFKKYSNYCLINVWKNKLVNAIFTSESWERFYKKIMKP